MARKKRVEEHINHDRWLVSYADFITLLFAFFVVMYSVSSVNEDKYRVLSDAMVSAFHEPKASLDPIQVGELVRSPLLTPDTVLDVSKRPSLIVPLLKVESDAESTGKGGMGAEGGVGGEDDESFSQKVLDAARSEVNAIADNVDERMESLIDDDIINVKRNSFWLEIEIKSSLLFPSGSSQLIAASEPVLIELSNIFVDLPNRIHIEGFTDNRPINTQIFPSNWELSSARAAAVVRLFERNGVEPSRLASIGYGEYQPITDNADEEARAKNRRVVVVVMASLEGRENERVYEFDLLRDSS